MMKLFANLIGRGELKLTEAANRDAAAIAAIYAPGTKYKVFWTMMLASTDTK